MAMAMATAARRAAETDADFGWEGAPYDAGHGHGDCPACGGDGYQVVKVPGCHERFVDCEECGCTGIGRQDAEADCPLCTGDSEARGLCDRHADELSQLTFTAEQLEAAAAR